LLSAIVFSTNDAWKRGLQKSSRNRCRSRSKDRFGKPAMKSPQTKHQNMSNDDLWASVIGTCHLKESVFELGIEVGTKLEEGKALLRVVTPGNPVKYAGPFKSSDLRCAAQVLSQAASLLDTKRKMKHFVISR
jgi:hypothetical protein